MCLQSFLLKAITAKLEISLFLVPENEKKYNCSNFVSRIDKVEVNHDYVSFKIQLLSNCNYLWKRSQLSRVLFK